MTVSDVRAAQVLPVEIHYSTTHQTTHKHMHNISNGLLAIKHQLYFLFHLQYFCVCLGVCFQMGSWPPDSYETGQLHYIGVFLCSVFPFFSSDGFQVLQHTLNGTRDVSCL